MKKSASEGTLSRWSWLHLQSLAPTNPHWARVVGYGPFSLHVIHTEGLCPSSGDINRLMMMNALRSFVTKNVVEFTEMHYMSSRSISFPIRAPEPSSLYQKPL
jgi:hypothetical protein